MGRAAPQTGVQTHRRSDRGCLSGLRPAASGTLTFAAGETTQTIDVTVTGDAIDEPDETFTVTLRDPVNATLDTASKLGNGSDTNFMAVFALLPSSMHDKTPPHISGNQLWYALLQPQGTQIVKIELRPSATDEELISVWTRCGLVFYLNGNGEVKEKARADNSRCPPNTHLRKITLMPHNSEK